MIEEPFDDMMSMLDSPVFVLTTQVDGRPSGCLVGFATQTSVQPPSFMVSIRLDSNTHEVASRSEYVALHLLPRRHHGLAALFGRRGDDAADTFYRCSWRAGPAGMPILDDAAAWFVAQVYSRSEVGDHVAYLLQPVAAWTPESAEDLLYLSDLDDDLDPGQEAPQRLHDGKRADLTGRYGMRFTLDVP